MRGVRRYTRGMRSLPAGWEKIYAVVRRIPRGKVTTYGAVAALLGRPRGARQVGFALAALRGAKHDVPWQRVLGARPRGRAGISILDPMGAAVQEAILRNEGVRLDDRGMVELERYGWKVRQRKGGGGGPRRRRARPPRRSKGAPRSVPRGDVIPGPGTGAGLAAPLLGAPLRLAEVVGRGRGLGGRSVPMLATSFLAALLELSEPESGRGLHLGRRRGGAPDAPPLLSDALQLSDVHVPGAFVCQSRL